MENVNRLRQPNFLRRCRRSLPLFGYSILLVASLSLHATAADLPPVKLATTPPQYFSSLQAAYDVAVEGSTIQALNTTITDSLIANKNINVALQGGYNSDYTSVIGTTYLKGSLFSTISSSGTLSIGNFAVTSINLTVDPVITPTNVNFQTISGAREDGGTITVTVNTGATVGSVAYPTATTWNCAISGMANGDNMITVGLTAGTGRTATVKKNIYSDLIPPTGSIAVNAGAAATNMPVVTLTISATDTQSGLSQMQFKNENGTWSTASTFATTATWTLSPGNGTKTVWARFKDVVGNWSAAYSDTIILDMSPPTVAISSPSSITTRDAAPLLIYTTSDGTAAVKVDGNIVTKASGSYLDHLTPGPHVVRVEATDVAGNMGFAEVNFVVDSSAPLAFSAVDATAHMIDTSRSESSMIGYVINGAATVTLKIISEAQGPSGALIYQSTNTSTGAGTASFVWDGRDQAGKVVPDEAYLYILSAVSGTATATYSPGRPTGAGGISCSQDTYDPNKNDPLTVNYLASQPERITMTISWLGSFNILNSVPRVAGNYSLDWDGRGPDGSLWASGASLSCTAVSLLRENHIVTAGDTPAVTSLRIDPYEMHLSYGQLTTIRYNLSRDANVTIRLVAPSGAETIIKNNQSQTAGVHDEQWTGVDSSDTTGKQFTVGSEGAYTVVVEAANPATGSRSSTRASLAVLR